VNFLWRIWFTPYHRQTKEEQELRKTNPKLLSGNSDKYNDCGFSHVYLGSEEPGHMGGYHNWYVMMKEQASAGYREVGSWEFKDSATNKVSIILLPQPRALKRREAMKPTAAMLSPVFP